MYPIKGKYSTACIMTDEVQIDPESYKQILQLVNHPVFDSDPKIMPDYHKGEGGPIGLTVPMGDKIIPNIVGMDIYCNMLTMYLGRLDWEIEDWLSFDTVLRRAIPMAFGYNKTPAIKIEEFPWDIANLSAQVFTSQLNERLNTKFKAGKYTPDWFFDTVKRIGANPVRAVNSLGSLGGGNHFIEFGISERTAQHAATVHSGSRNFGARICKYWQRVAKNYMQDKFIRQRNKDIMKLKCDLPMEKWDAAIKATKKPFIASGLEYLEGEDMYGYLFDMHFAGIYAIKNTQIMMAKILAKLNIPAEKQMEAISTVHNYLNTDDFIIRKGAVSSYKGEKMIIPFNMEDGILICEGKSNPEWNYSAPHGAGRLLARGQAKRDETIDVKAIRKRMNDKGAYATVIPKDEVKEAYKDPKFIEDAIAPTAKIIDRIKPIITLKADD